MKTTPAWTRGLAVEVGGTGIVSHVGTAALRLLASRVGLTTGLSTAVRRKEFTPVHDRGQVVTDLAVAIADGGAAISDIAALGDQGELLGPVASIPTAWRALDEITSARLKKITSTRAKTRRHVWTLIKNRHGAIPAAKVAGGDLGDTIVIRLDATIVIAHSDKERAAPTYKHTFGFQCAMRRSGVSPVQPGGTWKEVPGPDDLPDPETVMGTRACQETGGHAETLRMTRQEARVTWRKLNCLNPNLQRRQRRLHRHGV